MWSTMLALLCGAGMVAGAPQGVVKGRASSALPMEHRGQEATPIDFFGELIDTMFKSRTASAIDDIASHVTSAVGGFVDDIGDFVVGRVKDLPGTIDRISERVGDVVKNGEETVVIIVKGVRNTVADVTNSTGEVVVNGVDHVVKAVNQSKTLTSVQELEDSIRLSIARIGATILANMDEIDTAVADGIRTVVRTDNNDRTEEVFSPAVSDISVRLPQDPPSAAENDVRLID